MNKLTCRERVIKAINHEETERIPYNIPIHPKMRKKLENNFGKDFENGINNHIVGLSPEIGVFPPNESEEEQSGPLDLEEEEFFEETWTDEFGCVWKQNEKSAPHVEKHPLENPDLSDYEFPDFSDPERYKIIGKEMKNEENEDKFTVAGAGMLFFERAWALRGFEEILMDFRRNQQFVNDLLDNLLEVNLQVLNGILEYETDAVIFSDDYGMQNRLIMGPEIWREYLKPRLKRLYKRVKEEDKYVMIHSCGDNSAIMKDFIELGVDIFNPTQPEAMNIYELKERWGNEITFNGGVTTQKLPSYSPKQIRDEVKKIREKMSENGGYILETTKPLRWDVPLETAKAYIDEVKTQSF
ncbi:hypothetical protein AKJ64_03425 [candidate division MSBL1 archaeon SCGC-AAA259E17]|uniref:Uroporphyrinogen decarboxylase (URO-D) domain-containing protein n=1 Tax=candidate division MSBL1 archaeon SCGC-AAA259E17 TaxID=1698263 RepID=A0A133UDQ6_9EURY|nr:hypothetical protein AKJ64_03425 [candidate division MSBL1 archaeon SCGC-AAA259E17]